MPKDSFFKWSDDMCIHLKDIDEQHQMLVSMLNDLHEAMRTGKGADILSDMMLGLKDYTAFHFAHEEQLFDKHRYPGTVAHKRQHRDFAAKVEQFEEDFQSGKASLSTDIMNFLKEWLAKHIMVTDQKYGSFLRDRGES